MSIFAVDKWQDKIMLKDKREYEPCSKTVEKHHYFDTEEDARLFIRKRSGDAMFKAVDALRKAEARERKCWKKFGPKI